MDNLGAGQSFSGASGAQVPGGDIDYSGKELEFFFASYRIFFCILHLQIGQKKNGVFSRACVNSLSTSCYFTDVCQTLHFMWYIFYWFAHRWMLAVTQGSTQSKQILYQHHMFILLGSFVSYLYPLLVATCFIIICHFLLSP